MCGRAVTLAPFRGSPDWTRRAVKDSVKSWTAWGHTHGLGPGPPGNRRAAVAGDFARDGRGGPPRTPADPCVPHLG